MALTEIKLNFQNADEILAKIKEVLDGIEQIKKNLRELSEMGMGLDLSTQNPLQEDWRP